MFIGCGLSALGFSLSATSTRACAQQSLASQLLKRRQTTFSRFERRESATLLFDQVILHAADLLSGLEDFEPGRVALAEKRAIALIFARAPFLTMDGGDAARVGVVPGDRGGAGVHARSHVQFQRHGF